MATNRPYGVANAAQLNVLAGGQRLEQLGIRLDRQLSAHAVGTHNAPDRDGLGRGPGTGSAGIYGFAGFFAVAIGASYGFFG